MTFSVRRHLDTIFARTNERLPDKGELLERPLITKQKFSILAVFVVAAVVVTIQRGVYQFPNDYAIFRAAFWNLIGHQNIYVLRLDEARDYFKYSPTFALLFAPFAILPFVAGLMLWNVVNAIAMWASLEALLPQDRNGVAQILIALPTLRSMQSSQSNALVTALIVFAFICYERGWLLRGGGSAVLGAAIKLFPIAALSFALPRRDRLRAIGIAVLCTVILIALPLLVLRPTELIAQYKSWGALEKTEATLVGSSAMLLIRDAGLNWPAWPIQVIAGALILGALAVRCRDWGDRSVRLQFLALTLVFCVVFNHRAERESAVIAICGMVVWLLARPPLAWRIAVFAAIYSLVVLAGTDVVPGAIKRVLSPELRFTIPLTIGWLAIIGELVIPTRFTRKVRVARSA